MKNVKKIFYLQLAYHIMEKFFHYFSKRFKELIRNKFNVDINAYYTALETGSYFQLKFSDPMSMISNIVNKFTCSCDANAT